MLKMSHMQIIYNEWNTTCSVTQLSYQSWCWAAVAIATKEPSSCFSKAQEKQLILNYNHIQPCTIYYSQCEQFRVLFLLGYNMVIPVLLLKYPKDVDSWEPQVDSSVEEQKDTHQNFFPSCFNSILVACISHLLISNRLLVSVFW